MILFGKFVQIHLFEECELRAVGREIGSNTVFDKTVFDRLQFFVAVDGTSAVRLFEDSA